ncbi:MAG TPA: LssY C-terminal domain-containing protein [Planctomycetaceae bacterium]|nr:LssY C-terminal domain-containing protein [Planctomycetaceae bacterium]
MTPVATTILQRLFTTPYTPQPTLRTFMDRAQTQDGPVAQVTVAVADAAESERLFGVPLARRGLQPVYLRIYNHSDKHLRLHLVSIDPNYYTPLEAAALNHFSMAKRLSAFGAVAWLFFLPLLALIPFKLITAYRANRRIDECFRSLAFHLRPIPPGCTSEGFVFTTLDLGIKIVHIRLLASGGLLETLNRGSATDREVGAPTPAAQGHKIIGSVATDYTFSLAVPGIAADYHRRDFATLFDPSSIVKCDLAALVDRLRCMPAATTNEKGTGTGDPVNLVVIGTFDMLLSAFSARWDESETITLATCWKTVRAFLLGSQYRYSPVSPLYLFNRSQDIALQRSRHSINERIHLRLWLTPLTFLSNPVWVGQISRDIGVRFTTKAWNLTTHRIDPDVDESRDYIVEDLLQAERIEAAGYIDGVGPCDLAEARRNLTGDHYFTDGKRAAILLSTGRTTPRFVAWSP